MNQELPFLCMRLDRVQAAEKELVLQRKEPHTGHSSTPWGTI